MKIQVLLILLTIGCAPSDCYEKSNAILRELSEATSSVDRSCSVDADCVLVSNDLPCLQSCPTAVARSAEAEYVRLRDSVSGSCTAGCKSAFDCLNTPRLAKCRNAQCVAEP